MWDDWNLTVVGRLNYLTGVVARIIPSSSQGGKSLWLTIYVVRDSSKRITLLCACDDFVNG